MKTVVGWRNLLATDGHRLAQMNERFSREGREGAAEPSYVIEKGDENDNGNMKS
jgi:hypothetical protein